MGSKEQGTKCSYNWRVVMPSSEKIRLLWLFFYLEEFFLSGSEEVWAESEKKWLLQIWALFSKKRCLQRIIWSSNTRWNVLLSLSLSLSLFLSLSRSFSPIPASLFFLSLSHAFSSPLGRLTIFTAKSVKGNKRHVISPKQKMRRGKKQKISWFKVFWVSREPK